MMHEIRNRFVVVPALAVLAVAWAAAPAASAANTDGPTPPEGITVTANPATGWNTVTVGSGSDRIVIDGGGGADPTPPPAFTVETGAGTPATAAQGAVELVPGSRTEHRTGDGSGVVFPTTLRLDAAGEEIVLMDLGRVVSASDTVVWLPERRVLVTGRLCTPGRLFATDQTDSSAWIAALDRLGDLEPRWIYPGVGEPIAGDALIAQRDAIVDLRSRIESALAEGLGAERVIAEIDAAWFRQWREQDAPAAAAAARAVFDELSGRRTPWVLLEDRRLRAGPSPTVDDAGWQRPTRVLWRNRWPDRLPGLSQVAPGVEIVPFDSADEALELIAGADAVIGSASHELLEAGDDLRWVQVGSAGVERYLRIPRLRSGEVLLTNGQRLASPVIGEHAMALTRALARGLNRAVAAQLDGEWRRSEIGNDAPLTQLRGTTLLVVGLGGIGTEVARLADGAGMRVTAIRSSRRSGPPFVASVGLTEDLTAYVRDADVVVNCLPLTPDTTDIFDAELFDSMKPTAFFINVGRGGTVDTSALIEALESGGIAGAGLDVTDPEPLPEDHPLWRAPNLIITPHFAAWSDAGREIQFLLFRENLRRFAAGEALLSVVDPVRGY